MNKEQENQFIEDIKKIARLELKNSFNNNLMETLNSASIFKYIDTLEKQNQKYKEVIDKTIDKLESLRDFIRNESDYIVGASEIIVNITTIINILKELDKEVE